jgi:hypothetical protein
MWGAQCRKSGTPVGHQPVPAATNDRREKPSDTEDEARVLGPAIAATCSTTLTSRTSRGQSRSQPRAVVW